MKIAVESFKGLAPILSNRLLPPGFASSAVNAKLTSGDLDSYTDIGNPFQLAVDPVVNAIWLMAGPAPDYWLQWSAAQLSYGSNIDASLGTIPGDETYRTFITGLAGGPQQTNLYYATDPSQQGSNPQGAYPYVTFPLGIVSPTAAPTVVAPAGPAGPTTSYEYAQEASVNNASVADAGSGYAVGDVLTLEGGSLLVSGNPAQITINNVTSGGAIDTSVSGCISVSAGGFYVNNAGPGSTTINQAGLSLPAAAITLASTAGMAASGTISVANSGASNQTVNYSGISGNTLTGCSGGSGAVDNGAAVQASSVTVAASGGMGSGATFVVNVVPQQGSSNAPPSGWGFAPYNNGAGSFGQFSVGGGSLPYQWNISSGQGTTYVAYTTASFNLKTASAFSFQVDAATFPNGGDGYADLVFQFAGTFNGVSPFGQVVGPTLVLNTVNGVIGLYPTITLQNEAQPSGSPVATASYPFAGSTQYRIKISGAVANNSSVPGFSVTATVALSAAPDTALVTLNGFVPYAGEQFGVGENCRNGTENTYFENILITSTQPASQVASEATSYVYTYVTTYGSGADQITQESGPSDPSPTITYFLDESSNPVTMTPVSVSIPPAPSGLDIGNYNLYRLVQLADGSEVFEFVKQLASSTSAPTSYSDTSLDEALGDALLTTDYAPPPGNLQGILALPNGIMAGFFANTLCLSAQNFPFAWPVGNQLPTDTPIVAIAAIDSTVLVLTQANPYTAWGNDPSAYTMSKERAQQGCVSKRSAATHKRLGVIYASGNGLCYYAGQGELDLIRMPNGDPYFSVEQWQALNPASVLGVVHDDKYWFWYSSGGTSGGYVLDLSPAGFGLIELDFHVSAASVDPAADILYLVPDASVYPINGNVVGGALNVVSQWEGGSGLRPRSWERDEILLQRPTAFTLARVRAEEYSDLALTVSNENGTAFSGSVGSAEPFMIAPVVGIKWNIAATGSSCFNTVELVTQAEELAP